MGHASKQMVFGVYGNYVEGLEEDAEQIFALEVAPVSRTGWRRE